MEAIACLGVVALGVTVRGKNEELRIRWMTSNVECNCDKGGFIGPARKDSRTHISEKI